MSALGRLFHREEMRGVYSAKIREVPEGALRGALDAHEKHGSCVKKDANGGEWHVVVPGREPKFHKIVSGGKREGER